MAELIRTSLEDGGLDIVLAPDEAGGAALARPDLRAALLRALIDLPHGPSFVLIRGALPSALAGPDLPQAQDDVAPTVADLCVAIESCSVPVAVLIEGLASGRAAEFCLAAHCRLALPGARLCFSALPIGRLPGAGATLRLPRLIGAEQALRLMRGGLPVAAAEALALGLVDQVIEAQSPEARLAAARAALRDLSATSPGSQRSGVLRDGGLRDGRAFLRAVAAARAALAEGPAPLMAETALVDCVEAALLLPVEQGLSFAATRGAEVARSSEAAALTHIYRAELRAARVPAGLSAFEPATVRHLGLSGANLSLAGVVLTALTRGLSVTVCDADRAALVRFLETVAARQEAAVRAGQMTEAQRDADWARLAPGVEATALAEADLILAMPDAGLPVVARTVPVLLTGRGALPAGAFRLVLTGRAAELALPAASPGAVALTAWVFLRRMGLHVVLTGQQMPAGIAGRLAAAGAQALRAMLAMGLSPDALRSALAGFGQPLPDMPAPETANPPRQMPAEEIVHRWLGALANEGARLLQSGLTSQPGDIDLVAVAGLGFPRRQGGPMHQADQRGVLILRRDLAQWQADAPIWAPVGALDALVSLGRGFAGAIRTE